MWHSICLPGYKDPSLIPDTQKKEKEQKIRYIYQVRIWKRKIHAYLFFRKNNLLSDLFMIGELKIVPCYRASESYEY